MSSTEMKRWGDVAGKAESNKHEYLSMPRNGSYRVRIVSNVLPRYVYWIENASLGTPATFDAFNFNRGREKFDRALPDPIRDWDNGPGEAKGIFQRNKFSGKVEAIKPRKNYLAFVLDRDDNDKLKLMELKPSLLDSIKSMMKQLGKKGLQTPLDIDLVITRSGAGKDTVYSIEIITAMDTLTDAQNPDSDVAKRLDADQDLPHVGNEIRDDEGYLIGFEEIPSLSEVFPAPYNPEEHDSIEAAVEAYKKDVKDFMSRVKDDGTANKHEDAGRAADQGAAEAAKDI